MIAAITLTAIAKPFVATALATCGAYGFGLCRALAWRVDGDGRRA